MKDTISSTDLPTAVQLEKALEEERKKNKVKAKGFKAVWSVFTWMLVAVVMLIAVALVGVRLLGYTPYAILSPSMTPKYKVGDLVYVKKIAPAELSVGDVVTYVANKDLVLVTHRVDAIDAENGCVYTKGDANKDRDASPVYFENIVGVVKFSLPKLGNLSIYLSSESGKYVCAAALFSLLLLFILPELIKTEMAENENGKKRRAGTDGRTRQGKETR